MLENIVKDKYSNLLGPFVNYEENEMLCRSESAAKTLASVIPAARCGSGSVKIGGRRSSSESSAGDW
jgi:hypothetical protein